MEKSDLSFLSDQQKEMYYQNLIITEIKDKDYATKGIINILNSIF